MTLLLSHAFPPSKLTIDAAYFNILHMESDWVLIKKKSKKFRKQDHQSFQEEMYLEKLFLVGFYW